jgi:hypothetical protein
MVFICWSKVSVEKAALKRNHVPGALHRLALGKPDSPIGTRCFYSTGTAKAVSTARFNSVCRRLILNEVRYSSQSDFEDIDQRLSRKYPSHVTE